MRKPTPFDNPDGRKGVTIRASANIFLDHYEDAEKMAIELGYKSLGDYLDSHLADIVYWTLTKDHENNIRK